MSSPLTLRRVFLATTLTCVAVLATGCSAGSTATFRGTAAATTPGAPATKAPAATTPAAAYAGMWRAIPSSGPELQIAAAPTTRWCRKSPNRRVCCRPAALATPSVLVYEAYIPDGTTFAGQSLPPIRGLSPEVSRRANLLLGRGSGMRVQPGRQEEFDQLHTDYFAVWDRSRAYAAAVLALPRART
ncbi:hypothetical protein FB563_6215 [Streptomyces puniciscabiei]|uniref:Lipoprotein n=1 Tax=Streptomyces puniciscabiei TaxID=164348 RepID=A0A542TH55_9ACTN|nr:hypothetical protein FB563_6215 [Streptomyces puniciscabiei]